MIGCFASIWCCRCESAMSASTPVSFSSTPPPTRGWALNHIKEKKAPLSQKIHSTSSGTELTSCRGRTGTPVLRPRSGTNPSRHHRPCVIEVSGRGGDAGFGRGSHQVQRWFDFAHHRHGDLPRQGPPQPTNVSVP